MTGQIDVTTAGERARCWYDWSPGHGEAVRVAVVEALLAHDWEQEGDPENFVPELGLDKAELEFFVRQTQLDEWERLWEVYGEYPTVPFRNLVAREIDARGALDVLRHGVRDKGIRFRLASFRPAHTLAAGALDEYKANRLTVTPQLHFSAKERDKSIDLAFFVNGIPVATAELKNPATRQTVADARRQYRERDPREPLFATRTLVHFAVDPDLVSLTTRLAGSKTRFLPFNQGSSGPGLSGSAGNPPVGDRPYRTSYLWEEVLQRQTSWICSNGSSTWRTRTPKRAALLPSGRVRPQPAADLPPVPSVACGSGF